MNKNLLNYIEKHRKKRDENLKYDFMPNLLEIIERPAHVAGSVIIWSIFALLLFAIIWACVSKVEVVVSSQGKIIPVEDELIISAETQYKIDKIYVEEGQKVKTGDLLVELLPGELEEDLSKWEEEALKATTIVEVYTRIINGEDISAVDVSVYDAAVQADIEKIIREYTTNNTLFQQYENNNLGSEAEEARKQYIQQITDEKRSVETTLEEVNSEIEEIKRLLAAAKVTAPFDGTIYTVYINQEDVIVAENAPIVSMIKEDATLEMECYVSNKDIADINLNQKVNIKLEAYPYGDYGTIDGMVSFIGEKSTVVDGIGNVVVVKVVMTDEDFQEDLFPGMSGTVDMVVSQRRVIEYFMEPITEALRESIKEK